MGIFSFGPSKRELKKQILNLNNEKGNLESSIKKLELDNEDLNNTLSAFTDENTSIKNELDSLKISLEEMKYIDLKKEIEKLSLKHQEIISDISYRRATVQNLENDISNKSNEYEQINQKYNIELSKLENLPKKKQKIDAVFKSVEYSLNEYANPSFSEGHLNISESDKQLINELSPSISLKLHSMDIKDLRKSLKLNQEVIEDTLKKYESRYTTKANIAIYRLMVIALKAELQNVLYNLKYEALDKSLEDIKDITKKYLIIASSGNQSIAPTLSKFIGEIEYLFLDCVKIEYQYYVKKEQQRAEQAAIREQIKQEAAEKRELEKQKKQIEAEELKYKSEIEKIQEQLSSSTDNLKNEQLQLRIKELETQLLTIDNKKEEIISRQNGKAGNVYVISNLGSFGKNIFKIGMTRRLNPLERIKELGGASVPFTFDIHSFIFSDDAVSLEQKLHNILDDKRVNKINLRKEFFEISINELEELVNEIDPSAEFNKTMIAEEYNQSLSLAK